jgi:hypothetical protein
MSYVINANNTAGVISLHRDSAPGAVKKAFELLRQGLSNVNIIDDAGHQFRDPEEFKHLGDA